MAAEEYKEAAVDAAVTIAAAAEAAAAEEEEEEEEVEGEPASASAEAETVEAIGVILQRSAQKRSGSSTLSQGMTLTEEARPLRRWSCTHFHLYFRTQVTSGATQRASQFQLPPWPATAKSEAASPRW